MFFFTNRGRAVLLSLIIFIPLISFREELVFALTPPPPQERSDELTSEAFNSYKLNGPLFEAVRSDDLELVRSLLEGGIDKKTKVKNTKSRSYYNVNAEDSVGITPLIEATLLGNVELVELLLIHGARAQPSEGFRHTPLRAACLTANKELIALLLQKGADPNAQSEGGRTPLMGACYLRPQFDDSPERVNFSYWAVKAMFKDPRTDPRIKNEFGRECVGFVSKKELC